MPSDDQTVLTCPDHLDHAALCVEVDVLYSNDVTTKESKTSLESRLAGIESRLDKFEGVAKRITAPKGWWQRLWRWIKNNKTLAVLGIVITIIMGLYPGYENHVNEHLERVVDGELKAPIANLNHKLDDLSTKVAEVQGKLEVLDPLVREMAAQTMKKVALLTGGKLKDSLSEIGDAARQARLAKAVVPPSDIRDLGLRIIQQYPRTNIPEDAWQAVSRLLDYRSFLNVDQSRSLTPRPVSTVHLELNLKVAPGYEIPSKPQLGVLGSIAGPTVSPDKSATIVPLARAGTPSPIPGAEWLVLEIGKPWIVVIDGQFMRNVIITNSRVEYDGGSINLVSVYFLNYILDVRRTEQGVTFAQTFLSSVATNLSIQGGSAPNRRARVRDMPKVFRGDSVLTVRYYKNNTSS